MNCGQVNLMKSEKLAGVSAFSKIEELMERMLTREAEAISLSEQLAAMELRLKDAEEKNPNEDGAGGKRSNGILGNLALRHLEAYTGDHGKYSKWRSKVRGVLISEDENYGQILKIIESPH